MAWEDYEAVQAGITARICGKLQSRIDPKRDEFA